VKEIKIEVYLKKWERMTEEVEVDAIIVGGGVIGLSTAYQLLDLKPDYVVAVFEKNKFIGDEQSGRNSGVLHAGVTYRPGSLKAQLSVVGNKMLKEFAYENGIPCTETGKITVATNQEEEKTLDYYVARTAANGVPGARKISAREVREMEPNVDARCALYTPSTGIIDAAAYLKKLESLLKKKNALLFCDSEIVAISARDKDVVATVNQQGEVYQVKAKYLVNSAGLYGDVVGKMINPDFSYQIKPLRGEYLKFNRRSRSDIWMNGMNVYPTPKIIPGIFDQDGNPKRMAGTHLTPIFEYNEGGEANIGNTFFVGPLGHVIQDKDDYNRNRRPKEEFISDVKPFFPGLRREDLEEEMTGIQVKLLNYDDFVIEPDKRYPHCIHAIADSPGLTSSLAIGEKIAKIIK